MDPMMSFTNIKMLKHFMVGSFMMEHFCNGSKNLSALTFKQISEGLKFKEKCENKNINFTPETACLECETCVNYYLIATNFMYCKMPGKNEVLKYYEKEGKQILESEVNTFILEIKNNNIDENLPTVVEEDGIIIWEYNNAKITLKGYIKDLINPHVSFVNLTIMIYNINFAAKFKLNPILAD